MSSPSLVNPNNIATGRIVVGVADMAVTNDRNATIVTYALGSCIGVTIYDPVAHVGGLLHFMLPIRSDRQEREGGSSAMFGDTGIPMLFKECYALGAKKGRLIVCAIGGAEVLDDNGMFKIGTRNRTLLRKIFWKNGILMSAEDTGGTIARTVTMRMSDGLVEVRTKGEGKVIWPE